MLRGLHTVLKDLISHILTYGNVAKTIHHADGPVPLHEVVRVKFRHLRKLRLSWSGHDWLLFVRHLFSLVLKNKQSGPRQRV